MTLDDVADSASGSCWAVEERAWTDLPDEVIALIAPSVVVSAAPIAVAPAAVPAVPAVAAVTPLVKADRARMVTPALPRRLRRRRVRGGR